MSVLDRAALEASPLADLHAIASELSIDGYRRLRRGELVDAILRGDPGRAAETAPPAERKPEVEQAREAETDRTGAETDRTEAETDRTEPRRRRGRRTARGRSASSERAIAEEDKPEREDVESAEAELPPEDENVEGVVELLANGSGFVRVQPPDPSERDVYISSAQVKRCELVSGDRVSGPRRAPRRSERFASMVRIDAINGRPADEVTGTTRFDDLPATFPNERFELRSADPTINAIEWLTPLGRGSRVTICGPSRAGKSETLRRLAAALVSLEGLQISVALAGIRPEEIPDWDGSLGPTAAVSLAGSVDAQAHAVELVVDQARRVAARGADAVVLIDTLDGLHQHAARKSLAAARNIVDGGSLTVIATSSLPIGGETTVVALDRALAGAARYPAVELGASGTMRAELLVGEAGAEAITRARAEALQR